MTERGYYRRLHVRCWSDDRFSTLSPLLPSGQALWLWLLLGEHTTQLPGVWKIGIAGACESLGWQEDDFRRCWREIERAKMATADWRRRLVYVPNAMKYAAPVAATNVRGWIREFQTLPACALRSRAQAEISAFLHERDKALGQLWDQHTGSDSDSAEPDNKSPPEDEPAHAEPAAHGKSHEVHRSIPDDQQTAISLDLGIVNGDNDLPEGRCRTEIVSLMASQIRSQMRSQYPSQIRSVMRTRRGEEKERKGEQDGAGSRPAFIDQKESTDKIKTRTTLTTEEEDRLRVYVAKTLRKYPTDAEKIARVVQRALAAGTPAAVIEQGLRSLFDHEARNATAYLSKVLRVEEPNYHERQAQAHANDFKRATEGFGLADLVQAAKRASEGAKNE